MATEPIIPEFQPFPRIPRLLREVVVTEKIDGTNAQLLITTEGQIFPGSRNRWITPKADNFGFARWVREHYEELLALGPGRHFGEWFGCGIQRGYDLDEKRLALFNVQRWDTTNAPACCTVVPTLFRGDMSELNVPEILGNLRDRGSVAVPGFMDPEGVIVYHVKANQMFKATLDDKHKGDV